MPISDPQQLPRRNDRREKAVGFDRRIKFAVVNQDRTLAQSFSQWQSPHPFGNFILDLHADPLPPLDLDDISRLRGLDQKIDLTALQIALTVPSRVSHQRFSF